jgi:hypothetical protein
MRCIRSRRTAIVFPSGNGIAVLVVGVILHLVVLRCGTL